MTLRPDNMQMPRLTPRPTQAKAGLAGIRLRYWLLGSVFAVVLGYAALLGWREFRNYELPKVLIKDIRVYGYVNKHPRVQEILEKLYNQQFINVDIEAARQQILALGWIEQVSIRKKWPDQIAVNIKAYQPQALWENEQQKLQLLSVGGAIYNADNEYLHKLSNYQELPILAGGVNNAMQINNVYMQLKQVLAAFDLKIHKLKLNARNEWSLQTISGLQIKFLEKSQQQSIAQLRNILNLLKGEFANIASLDLRYNNGFALKPLEEK